MLCQAKASSLLIEDASLQSIMQTLQDRFPLNWRYCEHAVRDAKAQLQSQRELLPLYFKDIKDRIRCVERKLAKVRSEKKRESLKRQLAKLEKRERFYERHIQDGTIPKVAFGGTRSLEALMKGRLPREGWRELRNNQLYSIGQANQKGNANLRIVKMAEAPLASPCIPRAPFPNCMRNALSNQLSRWRF
ncbi:MAG: hypothetical protein AOA65_0662 [Candidatus Bathyarchaeota archaeon BA1]|nr:MAG: hypothetical protein AOA65_0662 [Candidatus Bathyarchaeota archaeon BA1]